MPAYEYRAVGAGSSPLARGLQGCCPHRGGTCWIIPARAGFTCASGAASSWPRDHPRSRGVYRDRARAARAPVGSSPLARGLRDEADHLRQAQGIIPARAGFTGLTIGSDGRPRDHPRSRGVYDTPGVVSPLTYGSSPLARGLPLASNPNICIPRIIPARAGFTSLPPWSTRCPRDHPRSRGVYRRPSRPGRPPRGSSPLARGLHRGRPHGNARGRIIPARAGFTRSSPPRRPSGSGSSPLARGLPPGGEGMSTHLWIIPARAGFTPNPRERRGDSSDHPRSRGVYG